MVGVTIRGWGVSYAEDQWILVYFTRRYGSTRDMCRQTDH